MIEMFAAMYLIVAFGMFLSGLFEGETIVGCIWFSVLWPVTLAYLMIVRSRG